MVTFEFHYCNPDHALRTTALTGTFQNPMALCKYLYCTIRMNPSSVGLAEHWFFEYNEVERKCILYTMH